LNSAVYLFYPIYHENFFKTNGLIKVNFLQIAPVDCARFCRLVAWRNW